MMMIMIVVVFVFVRRPRFDFFQVSVGGKSGERKRLEGGE
jgi:hypothetical protein